MSEMLNQNFKNNGVNETRPLGKVLHPAGVSWYGSENPVVIK